MRIIKKNVCHCGTLLKDKYNIILKQHPLSTHINSKGCMRCKEHWYYEVAMSYFNFVKSIRIQQKFQNIQDAEDLVTRIRTNYIC